MASAEKLGDAVVLQALDDPRRHVGGPGRVGVQAAVRVQRAVRGDERRSVHIVEVKAGALVAQDAADPREIATVRSRLVDVGAPHGTQDVDGRVAEAIRELGEVAAHVLDEVLGAVGVSPVVRPVGNDDDGRRVLAQQFHAAKRMGIKVVACDRLVHEVEAKRTRDLRRPGAAGRPHDVSLRDGVSQREQVAARRRLLEAAVRGEVAHGDGHEAGQVDRDVCGRVVGVVERKRHDAVGGGRRHDVGAVDVEVHAVNEALLGRTLVSPGAGELDRLGHRGALVVDGSHDGQVERDLVTRRHEADGDACRIAGGALAPCRARRVHLLV